MLHSTFNRWHARPALRIRRHTSVRHFARVAWLAAWVGLLVSGLPAGGLGLRADEPDKPIRDERSRRLEFMQSVIDEMEVSSRDIQNEAALTLGKTPILRYNDPTRSVQQTTGLLDAGVWRLGKSGRPTALVTLEIYRGQGNKAVLSYEFLSLVPTAVTIVSPRGPSWNPAGTNLKMAPLPEAPRPADSPKGRLAQMRQLSRRFAVHETLEDRDKVECRLLTQPIDRYADDKTGFTDGAIFVFANGTNPEVGLLLECNGEQWSYGLVRLSAAALFVDLDGTQVFEAPQGFGQPRTAPYMGTTHPIPLPE